MNTALTPSLAVLTVCEHLLLGRCSHVLTPVLVCVTVTSIPKLVREKLKRRPCLRVPPTTRMSLSDFTSHQPEFSDLLAKIVF